MGCDEPWLMDSGAFTQVALRGGYDQTPQAYAALVRRYAGTGLGGRDHPGLDDGGLGFAGD